MLLDVTDSTNVAAILYFGCCQLPYFHSEMFGMKSSCALPVTNPYLWAFWNV